MLFLFQVVNISEWDHLPAYLYGHNWKNRHSIYTNLGRLLKQPYVHMLVFLDLQVLCLS